MPVRIGIRREDKSIWERRVPIIPQDARRLIVEHGVEVWVQPSEVRAFRDEEFAAVGARVEEDLSPCPVVIGVKEIPPALLHRGTCYAFFSHVIKGQAYNMPMLQRLLDLDCTLIDYEKATDSAGRRLIFFGHYAGLAGMLDTLWALGQRLAWEGIANPFEELLPAWRYPDLAAAKAAVSEIGERIAHRGLPQAISPLICGFAGYGNVFRGADEIIRLLPVEEITPAALHDVATAPARPRDKVYKVVFREEHTVEPRMPNTQFELKDYYTHPEKYRSRFAAHLPYLDVLVNCIYWEPKYPRLVTKAGLRRQYSGVLAPRLRVIGDISCDIEGAIECTLRATDPGNPVYVYHPTEDRAVDGFAGHGPVVLAVDILPAELPRDASAYFSQMLLPYIPALARADYRAPLDELTLPPELKRAVIAHQGRLTPEYTYLGRYLSPEAE